MKRLVASSSARLLVAGLCLVASGSLRVPAQVSVQVPAMLGFKAPIHENNRLVALVSGKEAKPSFLLGEVQVTEFKLETYRYDPDRAPALIVESPGGTFGPRGARSDQPIVLRSADGRFAISGTGWAWVQSSGLLVISNRVRAEVLGFTERAAAGGAVAVNAADTNRPPIEIEAESFSYNLRTGAARFRGQCVASQTNRARLWAGELVSRLTPNAGPPDMITATNSVRIALLRRGGEGEATGHSAVYQWSESGERITIGGPATWQVGPGKGAADHLMLIPAKGVYSATGHARMRLSQPKAAAPAAGTAAGTGAGAGVSARPEIPIDIACDAIEATEEEVVFRGPVSAEQAGLLTMKAGGVNASLVEEAGTGRRVVNRMVATNDVRTRVTLGTNEVAFRGERMVYDVATKAADAKDRIEMTGEPSWTARGSVGTAERFLIHPDDSAFEALDRVRVRWTSSDATDTNVPPVELSTDRLRVDREQAHLAGNVAAKRDRWDLKAGDAVLLLATNSAVREIVATQDVVMNYLMPQLRAPTNSALPRTFTSLFGDATGEVARWTVRAPRVKATLEEKSAEFARLEATGGVTIRNVALQGDGGRLTYEARDGMLRLADNAKLNSPDGVDIVGEPNTTLGLDPHTGQFVVDGPVTRMKLPAPKVQGRAIVPGGPAPK